MTDEELKMLDEAIDAESGLRPRELDFIEDLDERYRNCDLSPKQSAWIGNIADRLA